jgi:hypothetical protein
MSKKTFTSKYTDRLVTDAQYICDEIMERLAGKDNEILPYKYWTVFRWKKIFLWQLIAANKILKEVDVISVMAFLRSKKGRNIYSLGLRSQIVEGAKNFIIVRENTLEEEISMDILVDLPDIDVKVETKNKTLWEQL